VFENVLFQDRAVNQLVAMVREKRVPPSLLFVGPEGSGKLTTALELARSLSCEKHADWGCSCGQCARYRSLAHPDLLLLGPREFPEEIRVTATHFANVLSPASYYGFVRAVRKLLRRFDAPLWAGEETKLAKAVPILESCEELLEEIALLVEHNVEHSMVAHKIIERLRGILPQAVEVAARLEAFVPDGIPIFMVRNMISWANLAPSGRQKVVILQNADTANESARNAMLKILEEPPDSVRFILTSSRRAALIATILSRSQLILFDPRTKEQTAQIISTLYGVNEDATSIGEFFLRQGSYPLERANNDAALFLGMLLKNATKQDPSLHGEYAAQLIARIDNNNESIDTVLKKLSESTGAFGAKDASNTDSFLLFLKALTHHLSGLAQDPHTSPTLLVFVDRLSARVRDMGRQYRTFNRSPELMLEAFALLSEVNYETSI